MLLNTLRKPRLILFLVAFTLVATVFWKARAALTPFVMALVIAYLMLPLVNRVQALLPEGMHRRGIARPLAILIVYLIVTLAIMLAVRSLLQPLVNQINALLTNVPALYEQGVTLVNDALEQYYQEIPPEIQQQIAERLGSYNPMTLLNPVLSGGRQAVSAITSTVSFILGLIIIPFWLFFVLNDQGPMLQGTMNVIPRDLRPDVEAVRIIIDRVFSAYIRGQLLVAFGLGTAISIGLFLLKIEYSLLLGLVAGLLALLPFIGSVLGAIPSIIVAFFQSPEQALWVAGLFLIVQQIDNVFFSPKIIGEAVELHPALIVVVLVVGSTLFGVAGALVAVPSAAILRDVVHYFYLRVGEEPVGPIEALRRVGYGKNITPRLQEGPPSSLATSVAS